MARPARNVSVATVVRRLAATGRRFYERNWVLGTSGNFSAVVSRRPFRLAITASGAHKGLLGRPDFVQVDSNGDGRTARAGRPSAEIRLHLEIVRARGAGAVLHTHSVWGTILSDLYAEERGLLLQGFEMLKGLSGVTTHEHREWLPIVENDQDMIRLSSVVGRMISELPGTHAFLIRRHGLYTWGDSVEQAERHVEILEFLLEAVGRRRQPWR